MKKTVLGLLGITSFLGVADQTAAQSIFVPRSTSRTNQVFFITGNVGSSSSDAVSSRGSGQLGGDTVVGGAGNVGGNDDFIRLAIPNPQGINPPPAAAVPLSAGPPAFSVGGPLRTNALGAVGAQPFGINVAPGLTNVPLGVPSAPTSAGEEITAPPVTSGSPPPSIGGQVPTGIGGPPGAVGGTTIGTPGPSQPLQGVGGGKTPQSPTGTPSAPPPAPAVAPSSPSAPR